MPRSRRLTRQIQWQFCRLLSHIALCGHFLSYGFCLFLVLGCVCALCFLKTFACFFLRRGGHGAGWVGRWGGSVGNWGRGKHRIYSMKIFQSIKHPCQAESGSGCNDEMRHHRAEQALASPGKVCSIFIPFAVLRMTMPGKLSTRELPSSPFSFLGQGLAL